MCTRDSTSKAGLGSCEFGNTLYNQQSLVCYVRVRGGFQLSIAESGGGEIFRTPVTGLGVVHHCPKGVRA